MEKQETLADNDLQNPKIAWDWEKSGDTLLLK